MSASSSQSQSDTSRLIEAIRCLDHTLRAHHQSPAKDAKDGRSLSRKTSSALIGSQVGSAVGERPKSNEVTRTDKVMVEVRVVFLKIGEIDTQKEKYTADVFLQAKWKEPRLDGQSDIIICDLAQVINHLREYNISELTMMN